ncbi:MAG: class I SAM-dependent methyltransferase [Alphaproteobacteria bacterium]|nr:class I SAM-dependent methyltransferase [Alphaproteobacteria bacterium]
MKHPGLMIDESHDEGARMRFVAGIRGYIGGTMMPGARAIADEYLTPAFRKKAGHDPDRRDLRKLAEGTALYPWTSALRRTQQEMMWDTSGDTLKRQWPTATPTNRGSATLRLDPMMQTPRYLSAVDIHCMPGNYHSELTDNDAFAGALYDHVIVSNGYKGDDAAGVGGALAAFVTRNFPDLRVRRVLDVGCTVGHSTLAYTHAFPDAEIHAIDVAAPCLRYAKARADAANAAVQFSQQNAERTDFKDGSFDLIVSTITLHETSNKAIRNIYRECRRLLRPGGVMVHCESQQYFAKAPFDAQWHRWGAHFNAEPFMETMHEMELKSLAVACGFDATKSFPQVPMLSTLAPDMTVADPGRAPKTYPEILYVAGAVR